MATKQAVKETKQDTNEFLSPYKAAGYVNGELEKAGLTKRIPAQMMYNYTTTRVNQGKKPLIDFDPKTGVNQKSLEEWTVKYIAKQS